ncbi:hypothetical protein N9251_02120 [Gammaproteobacteria bacterium]|nr:hypothetical protein [Gammaproteobacteria bacterium]
MKKPTLSYLFGILCLLLPIVSLSAESTTSANVENVADTPTNVAHLESLFSRMEESTSGEYRKFLSDSIKVVLYDELIKEGSFDTEFPNMPILRCVTASDDKIRLFTWNVEMENGTNGYVCFMQTSDGYLKYFDKVDRPSKPRPQDRIRNRWYGCVYTGIIPQEVKEKTGKRTVYLLFGWACNSVETRYNIVDVIGIDERNRIEFGYDLFKVKNEKKLLRLIFTHDRDSRMVMEYQPQKKRIVMDHLVPIDKKYRNKKKQAMGPDHQTYDALKRSGNKWKLVEDVRVKRLETSE